MRSTMTHRHLRIALCSVLASASVGCGIKGVRTHGASTVRPARFNYNEAIVESQDRQMLLNLVRVKTGGTAFYLDVESAVTKYEYGGSVGASFGLTRGKTVTSNPGSAVTNTNAAGEVTETVTAPSITTVLPRTPVYGATADGTYKQTPTITYKPLKGTEFAALVSAPMFVGHLVALVETGWNVERLLDCCVQRVNELKNTVVVEGSVYATSDKPRGACENCLKEFDDLAKLLARSQKRGNLWFMRTGDPSPKAAIRVDCSDPEIASIRKLIGQPSLCEAAGAAEIKIASSGPLAPDSSRRAAAIEDKLVDLMLDLARQQRQIRDESGDATRGA